MMITSFQGTFAFLSNFFPIPVMLDGRTYPTVEHGFQAAKTEREEEREAIRWASTPGRAKRLGRKVALRPDWDAIKVDVMLDLLRQKFSDPVLHQRLLATGDAPLIEGNTWGDCFWGCVLEKGKWVGENTLGRLLMQVRGELKAR